MITAREFVERVGGRWNGRTAMVKCPAHDDQKESLAVSVGDDGHTLLFCHANCSRDEIAAAAGVEVADLYPDKGERKTGIVAEYDYVDEHGTLLYQVVRMEPKSFRQRKPDGAGWSWSVKGVRRVLYRLPQILSAPEGEPVVLVEGEKDVHRLERAGLLATTVSGGAARWRDEYAESLRGRPVVILPDNDEAGKKYAQRARQALNGVASSVRVVELPGLPKGGDVSDWLRGHSDADLMRQLRSGRAMTLAESMEERRRERESEHGTMMPTGIDFIDDRLGGGVMCKDFLVISARTGAGKTTLGQAMARMAAQAGRRPFVLALEAYRGEVSDRFVYGELSRLAWANKHPEAWDLTFRRWVSGQCRGIESAYLEQAEAAVRSWASSMLVLYREDRFTASDIVTEMLGEEDADFWIFDHVHYVDSDDPNDNRALKEVTSALRDVTLRSSKPVVAIAHMRKPMGPRKGRLLVPNLDEIHGSSDLTKIATGVITVAPWPDREMEPHRRPTICRVDKERYDGAGDPYVGLLIFNMKRARYEPGYSVARSIRGGEDIEAIPNPNDWPRWAKRARIWSEGSTQ